MTCTRMVLAALVTTILAGATLAQANQALQLTTGVDGGVIYQYDPRFLPQTGITVEAWVTFDDSTMPTGQNYWPTIARMNVNPNQESWTKPPGDSSPGRASYSRTLTTIWACVTSAAPSPTPCPWPRRPTDTWTARSPGRP